MSDLEDLAKCIREQRRAMSAFNDDNYTRGVDASILAILEWIEGRQLSHAANVPTPPAPEPPFPGAVLEEERPPTPAMRSVDNAVLQALTKQFLKETGASTVIFDGATGHGVTEDGRVFRASRHPVLRDHLRRFVED
jgi:hypothetical protein